MLMDPEDYLCPPSDLKPAPKWWLLCRDKNHPTTILTDTGNTELLVAFCSRCKRAQTVRGKVETEDALDLKAVREALSEPGRTPFAEVKKELGIT